MVWRFDFTGIKHHSGIEGERISKASMLFFTVKIFFFDCGYK